MGFSVGTGVEVGIGVGSGVDVGIGVVVSVGVGVGFDIGEGVGSPTRKKFDFRKSQNRIYLISGDKWFNV